MMKFHQKGLNNTTAPSIMKHLCIDGASLSKFDILSIFNFYLHDF